jgi:hypothetical protein
MMWKGYGLQGNLLYFRLQRNLLDLDNVHLQTNNEMQFSSWVSVLDLCVDGPRVESCMNQNFLLLAIVNML